MKNGVSADSIVGTYRLQPAVGINKYSSGFFSVGVETGEETPCISHLEVIGIKQKLFLYCLKILLQTTSAIPYMILDYVNAGLKFSFLTILFGYLVQHIRQRNFRRNERSNEFF